mmetsp:Transcript_16593/g.45555  ORF Transcript_16593/g.45555 Transcript_16593/m.45555 type:complete len:217 (+) Transcript_16593:4240-4890(+)
MHTVYCHSSRCGNRQRGCRGRALLGTEGGCRGGASAVQQGLILHRDGYGISAVVGGPCLLWGRFGRIVAVGCCCCCCCCDDKLSRRARAADSTRSLPLSCCLLAPAPLLLLLLLTLASLLLLTPPSAQAAPPPEPALGCLHRTSPAWVVLRGPLLLGCKGRELLPLPLAVLLLLLLPVEAVWGMKVGAVGWLFADRSPGTRLPPVLPSAALAKEDT